MRPKGSIAPIVKQLHEASRMSSLPSPYDQFGCGAEARAPRRAFADFVIDLRIVSHRRLGIMLPRCCQEDLASPHHGTHSDTESTTSPLVVMVSHESCTLMLKRKGA
jgi:hypothetical protein